MTEYAYESIDDANADLNRLIDELKDARRANRALLAQLDEARTDAIKDREAFAAALVIDADRLRAELAAMTARKDGWRRVALMYREQYKEMIAPFGAESDCRTWSKQRREARND